MENCDPSKKEVKSSRNRLDELFKSPALRFPGRRRKRQKVEPDNISLTSIGSICSVDSVVSCDSSKSESKRKKAMNRMSSIASLLSPVKPVKKVGHALQIFSHNMFTHKYDVRAATLASDLADERSLSLRSLGPLPPHHRSNILSSGSTLETASEDGLNYSGLDTPSKSIASYREPLPTPPKRRVSVLWSDTIISKFTSRLSQKQLKRQEAIFELYKSEQDMVEDLLMIKKTYYNSMISLKIMDKDEIDEIFGHINELIPMHEELVTKLKQQRLPDGTTNRIGAILIEWIPQLKRYVDYCSNQIFAKDLLDRKKSDPVVEDFLKRCQNSPFSRKLDLWSFLDVPRSSLVKYPLLFKNIINYTADITEVQTLELASSNIEDIISDVNVETGKAKCRFIRSHLDYLEEKQHHKFIDESEAILCDGVLRNSRGTKIQGFLFEKILVLTRQASRGSSLRYQVYREPLPISGPQGTLEVEDLKDGAKMGSFKSTFSNSNTGKNLFKVSYGDLHHTLQANDEHDKRMWLNSLRTIISDASEVERDDPDDPEVVTVTPDDEVSINNGDEYVVKKSSPTPSRTSVDSALSRDFPATSNLGINDIECAEDGVEADGAPCRRCLTPDQLPTEDVMVEINNEKDDGVCDL